MTDAMRRVQDNIGYRFEDSDLLQRALTHSSFGDGNKLVRNYERLEFLGDRVLGLIAAETLFRKFKTAKEGRLAPLFNSLVDKNACERAARLFELGTAIRMSPSEEKIGGRDKASILADATESVMAAVYIDGGLEAARGVFEKGWGEAVDQLTDKPRNPKSDLQELAAKRGFGMPRYDLMEQAGPDHRPIFIVRVELDGFEACDGQGGSKQEAQRNAANAMLQRITGND